jgi:hypothetical protein
MIPDSRSVKSTRVPVGVASSRGRLGRSWLRSRGDSTCRAFRSAHADLDLPAYEKGCNPGLVEHVEDALVVRLRAEGRCRLDADLYRPAGRELPCDMICISSLSRLSLSQPTTRKRTVRRTGCLRQVDVRTSQREFLRVSRDRSRESPLRVDPRPKRSGRAGCHLVPRCLPVSSPFSDLGGLPGR